jgi:hypothetical protein
MALPPARHTSKASNVIFDFIIYFLLVVNYFFVTILAGVKFYTANGSS